MSLESGPFLTMVTLGVAGLSAFPWPTLVGGILPLLVGMLLGNLDREMREFLEPRHPGDDSRSSPSRSAPISISRKVWQAGLLGVGLGLAVVLVTGIPLFFADRLTGGNGVAGVAAASTAGNAVAVPGHCRQRQPGVRGRRGAGHHPGGGQRGGHRHRGAAGDRMDARAGSRRAAYT